MGRSSTSPMTSDKEQPSQEVIHIVCVKWGHWYSPRFNGRLPLLQHFCHVPDHISFFTSPSSSPSPPPISPKPRYSFTLIYHLGALPYASFSSWLGMLNTPWSSPLLHFHMTLQQPQHPSALTRMLTRSLTQLLHVVLKFFASEEVPCSGKSFGHICTAKKNGERGRQRGEHRAATGWIRSVSSQHLGLTPRSYWLTYNGCSWRHQSMPRGGGGASVSAHPPRVLES